MKEYKKRYIDLWLKDIINGSGMIVIDGVKGSGKTEAGKHICKSSIMLDNSNTTKIMLENDPNIILKGEKPRLIDEWQLYPWIWNNIRHAVDDDMGTFILTGSSTPIKDKTRHSGAGRAMRYKLRPMSWYEIGWSNGEISLHDVINNKIKLTDKIELSSHEKISRLKQGGWPFLLKAEKNKKHELMKEYVNSICQESLIEIDDAFKDTKLAENLLKSLARNISTNVSFETIRDDMRIHNANISQPSIYTYYNLLERIYIIEDLPAWSTHIRSSTTLRTTVKRYFVDPSIAIAISNLSVEKLEQDPKYLGFIFENEVVKNLRIYGESLGAKLYYYGENFRTTIKGVKTTILKEVDIIMEFPDGNWAAFEVKYGFNDMAIESAANSLNRLLEVVDFNVVKKPLSLNIITCDGFAYKRKKDGINVIPLCYLRGEKL